MKLFFLSPDCPPEFQRLTINGKGWGLLEHEVSSDAPIPSDFICASYSWGPGRSHNPLHPSFAVSDRTLPALLAVIAQCPSARKIWIDAFCVPHPGSLLRGSTLQSMGFIYSRAAEVFVVLTSSAFPVLQHALRGLLFTSSHLAILEAEDWVTRAWTYQEAVNSHRLRITCTSPSSTPEDHTDVDIIPFLSLLGASLSSLPASDRPLYPRLNSLEDLLVDCIISPPLERSALQVMINMEGRTQSVPDDHFYAMMGAISTEPTKAVEGVSACKAFMRLCERKGDYSFLFCKEQREEEKGRRWRPKEGELRPVINLVTGGGVLKGRAEGQRVVIERVVELELGELGEKGRGWIERWLVGFEMYGCWPGLELERAAYEALKFLGFLGAGEHLETEVGLVFVQNAVPRSARVRVIVAGDIRWTLGSPALVQYSNDGRSGELLYEPGIFFGQMREGVDVPRDVVLE